MTFNTASDTFSQKVVSESAATCWAENLAASKISKINLDAKSISELFGREIQFNSISLSQYLSLFKEKM